MDQMEDIPTSANISTATANHLKSFSPSEKTEAVRPHAKVRRLLRKAQLAERPEQEDDEAVFELRQALQALSIASDSLVTNLLDKVKEANKDIQSACKIYLKDLKSRNAKVAARRSGALKTSSSKSPSASDPEIRDRLKKLPRDLELARRLRGPRT